METIDLTKIKKAAQKRWDKGGKEIYEALQNDPEFVHSPEYEEYLTKVHCEMASDPDTPADVLEKLSNDSDKDVRLWVAWNPSTPISILEKLANDPNVSVRRSVAQNPSTPIAIIEKLANDPDNWVRFGAAENSSTPITILEQFADDANEHVRLHVVRNPSTPTAIVEKLLPGLLDHARHLSTLSGAKDEFEWFMDDLGYPDIHCLPEDLEKQFMDVVENLQHIDYKPWPEDEDNA